jgi:hypothetical protein
MAAQAPAARASTAVSVDEAEAVLREIEAAYRREDLPRIMALHAPAIHAQLRATLKELFTRRNYFALSHRIVRRSPLEDGNVQLDVATVLRSRPVDDAVDRREKTRWTYRMGRLAPGGPVLVVDSKPGPQRPLPADGPWRPEEWVVRLALRPAGSSGLTPEGSADVELHVRLRNASHAAQRELAFGLHPFVDALSAELQGGGALALARDEGSADTWWGTLPAEVPAGGAIVLRLRYAFDEVGVTEASQLGRDGAWLSSPSAWHPVFRQLRPDDPLRATHDVTVVVPPGWSAVAPGVLAARTDLPAGGSSWRWFSRSPGSELAVVAGELAREETPLRPGLVVETWRRAGGGGTTEQGMGRMPERIASALRWLEDELGPAPVDRVTVVEYGGRALRAAPAWIAVPSDGPLVDGTSPRDEAPAVYFAAHQLAHAWLVDRVETADGGARALLEGACDHLAAAWAGEDVDERLPEQFRLQVLDVAGPRADLDRPIVAARDGLPFDGTFGRGKAHVALEMYRAFAGEDAWRRALRALPGEVGAGPVTSEAIVAALAGDDPRLLAFCGTWILGRGFADFVVGEVTSTEVVPGRFRIDVAVANQGVGPAPLLAVISTVDGLHEERLDLATQEAAVITYEAGGAAREVWLDPDHATWQGRFDNDAWPTPRKTRRPELSHPLRADPARIEDLGKQVGRRP